MTKKDYELIAGAIAPVYKVNARHCRGKLSIVSTRQ